MYNNTLSINRPWTNYRCTRWSATLGLVIYRLLTHWSCKLVLDREKSRWFNILVLSRRRSVTCYFYHVDHNSNSPTLSCSFNVLVYQILKVLKYLRRGSWHQSTITTPSGDVSHFFFRPLHLESGPSVSSTVLWSLSDDGVISTWVPSESFCHHFPLRGHSFWCSRCAPS